VQRLARARERAICDIGYLRVRAITRQSGCDLFGRKNSMCASLSEHPLWKRMLEDGCWLPDHCRCKERQQLHLQDEGQCQHKITCIAVPLLLLRHWQYSLSPGTQFNIKSGTISPNAHTTHLSHITLRKPNTHQSNALSLLLHTHSLQAHANFPSVPSLPRPTRSRVVPSSRLVCTYIYKATECELAPLMSQISNVHPATLS
jgi:hypothetical protein